MLAVLAEAKARVQPCHHPCCAWLSGAVPRAVHRREATEEPAGFRVRAFLIKAARWRPGADAHPYTHAGTM